jgi:5-methylcytosine-specific restriction protein B
MPPSADRLEDILRGNDLDETTRRRLVGWFRKTNSRASTNPAAAVGHAYFSDVVDSKSLQDVWDYQLKYLVNRAFQYDLDSRTEVIKGWDAIFASAPAESGQDTVAGDESTAPSAET